MADALSSILACSIGSSSLRLETWGYSAEPKVEEKKGRVGTDYRITGEGWVEGTSAADLAAKLATALNDFSIGGRDARITVPATNTTLVQLLAAQMSDGGPFAKVEVLQESGVAFAKKIKFEVNGYSSVPPDPDDGSAQALTNKYSEKIAISPSGLHTFTREGEVSGPGSIDYFFNSVYPSLKDRFGPPDFVITVEYEASTDANALSVSYTMVATENFSPLPAGGGVQAVKGKLVVSIDRDEQMRKTTRYDYDLVVTGGAAEQLLPVIRPKDKTILKESAQVGSIEDNTLRASFTILEGGDGDNLLNWSQTAEKSGGFDTWEEIRHPGADPIVVKAPKAISRVMQQGSAVGAGYFPKLPDALSSRFFSMPRVTIEHVNHVEKKISWSYDMFMDDGSGNPLTSELTIDPDKIDRPKADPGTTA